MMEQASFTGRAPDIGECLQVGWDRFQKQMVPLILATLIFSVLLVCVWLLSIVAFFVPMLLLLGPLTHGIWCTYRQAYREEPVSYETLFAGFQVFVPSFLNGLMFAIAVMVGSMLCIIPGYIVMGLAIYWPLTLADGKKSGIDALMASVEVAKPYWVMATVTVFVLNLISSLGSIACGIGLLFTVPIAFIGMIHAFEMMRGTTVREGVVEEPPAPEEPTGPAEPPNPPGRSM